MDSKSAVKYENYFTESHEILRDSVKQFVKREIAPHVDQWEKDGIIPRELFKKAGDAGFFGIGFPEQYGGTDCDIFHEVVFAEEINRCGSGGLVASLGSIGIGLPPIVNLGTEAQKQKYVPPVLAGDKIAVLAITEPCGGSDVANIQTKAVKKGDTYIVNGSKTFITSGTRADTITALVRTGGPGAGGLSLLIIEKDFPGFSVSNKIEKMGWHASDTAELAFDDCEVPAANLLGAEGSGFIGAMLNFRKERLYLAIAAQITAELALNESIKYARDRVAFGKPISKFQVTRHKIAEMATLTEAAKAFNYHAAALIGSGVDCYKEVCMAKNFATDAAHRVVNDAVQIHGGYGYCREYLVERLYRDERILSIGGGTHEIMNEVIAKRLEL